MGGILFSLLDRLKKRGVEEGRIGGEGGSYASETIPITRNRCRFPAGGGSRRSKLVSVCWLKNKVNMRINNEHGTKR